MALCAAEDLLQPLQQSMRLVTAGISSMYGMQHVGKPQACKLLHEAWETHVTVHGTVGRRAV